MIQVALNLILILQIVCCPIICRVGTCSCCQLPEVGERRTNSCCDAQAGCKLLETTSRELSSRCGHSCCREAIVINTGSSFWSVSSGNDQDFFPPEPDSGSNVNCVCHGAIKTDQDAVRVTQTGSDLPAYYAPVLLRFRSGTRAGIRLGPGWSGGLAATGNAKCAWLQSWVC